MRISFIIPMYNAAGTIVRCLDSIYSLPLKEDEFEIIAVDDCSIDNTLTLVRNYSKQHDNLRVIHQSVNKRQGAARNRGLEEALGAYIMYVDADDEVAIGLIDSLQFALNNNLDMLFCTTSWENENHEFIPRKYNIPIYKVMSGHEFANNYYDEYCVGPWTYLWKRDFLILANIPFIENRRMEDFDFVEKHIILAERIAFSNNVIYNYHINQGSTVRTTSWDTVADWVHVCYRRWKFCESLPSELSHFIEKIDEQCKCFIMSSLSLRRLSRFPSAGVRKIFARIGKEELLYISKKWEWPYFTRLCVNRPNFVVAIIALVYPITQAMRSVVRYIRLWNGI